MYGIVRGLAADNGAFVVARITDTAVSGQRLGPRVRRVLDGGRELRRVERLHHVRLEAGGEHPPAIVHAGLGGEGDGGDPPERASPGTELAEERAAVLARHRDVAHHDVRLPPTGD